MPLGGGQSAILNRAANRQLQRERREGVHSVRLMIDNDGSVRAGAMPCHARCMPALTASPGRRVCGSWTPRGRRTRGRSGLDSAAGQSRPAQRWRSEWRPSRRDGGNAGSRKDSGSASDTPPPGTCSHATTHFGIHGRDIRGHLLQIELLHARSRVPERHAARRAAEVDANYDGACSRAREACRQGLCGVLEAASARCRDAGRIAHVSRHKEQHLTSPHHLWRPLQRLHPRPRAFSGLTSGAVTRVSQSQSRPSTRVVVMLVGGEFRGELLQQR